MTETARLSIVLACHSGIAESKPALRHLVRIGVGRATPVILVAHEGVVKPDELEPWREHLDLRLKEVDSSAQARGEFAAHAILDVETPFVAVIENHSFAEPGAHDRIVAAWDDGDAAVSPAIRSANPETLRSLAMYLVAYGHAGVPADPRPRSSLPFHNSVYRTELLRAYGVELPRLMSQESRLHATLLQSGHRLRVAPDAITWHLNEARWGRAFSDPFILGLRYAVDRSGEWSLAKRIVYGAAFPAVAALRLRALWGHAGAADTRQRRLALLPMLGLMAGLGAIGEAWGYLLPDRSPDFDFERHEFHVRGRLAGLVPRTPWIAQLVADLPADLE